MMSNFLCISYTNNFGVYDKFCERRGNGRRKGKSRWKEMKFYYIKRLFTLIEYGAKGNRHFTSQSLMIN